MSSRAALRPVSSAPSTVPSEGPASASLAKARAPVWTGSGGYPPTTL